MVPACSDRPVPNLPALDRADPPAHGARGRPAVASIARRQFAANRQQEARIRLLQLGPRLRHLVDLGQNLGFVRLIVLDQRFQLKLRLLRNACWRTAGNISSLTRAGMTRFHRMTTGISTRIARMRNSSRINLAVCFRRRTGSHPRWRQKGSSRSPSKFM